MPGTGQKRQQAGRTPNLRAVGMVLWGMGLALMLAASARRRLQATKRPRPRQASKRSRRSPSIVAVFRLEGPVTEVPADDLEQMFGQPGVSLKDLVTRLGKAAADPAVKAVVILPKPAGWGRRRLRSCARRWRRCASRTRRSLCMPIR